MLKHGPEEYRKPFMTHTKGAMSASRLCGQSCHPCLEVADKSPSFPEPWPHRRDPDKVSLDLEANSQAIPHHQSRTFQKSVEDKEAPVVPMSVYLQWRETRLHSQKASSDACGKTHHTCTVWIYFVNRIIIIYYIL